MAAELVGVFAGTSARVVATGLQLGAAEIAEVCWSCNAERNSCSCSTTCCTTLSIENFKSGGFAAQQGAPASRASRNRVDLQQIGESRVLRYRL